MNLTKPVSKWSHTLEKSRSRRHLCEADKKKKPWKPWKIMAEEISPSCSRSSPGQDGSLDGEWQFWDLCEPKLSEQTLRLGPDHDCFILMQILMIILTTIASFWCRFWWWSWPRLLYSDEDSIQYLTHKFLFLLRQWNHRRTFSHLYKYICIKGSFAVLRCFVYSYRYLCILSGGLDGSHLYRRRLLLWHSPVRNHWLCSVCLG